MSLRDALLLFLRITATAETATIIINIIIVTIIIAEALELGLSFCPGI